MVSILKLLIKLVGKTSSFGLLLRVRYSRYLYNDELFLTEVQYAHYTQSKMVSSKGNT